MALDVNRAVALPCRLWHKARVSRRSRRPPPPRGEAARVALAEAAVRLFSTRGFESTTIDDVARAAGVSRRSFFRHFKNKEDAAFPDHAERLARFVTALAERDRSRPKLEGILAVCRRFAGEIFAGPAFYAPRYRLVASCRELRLHELETDVAYEAAVVDALLDGERSPSARVRAWMIATAAMAAVNEVLGLWAARDGRLDAEAMLDRALDELLTAFAEPKAAGRRDRGDLVVVVARADVPRAELARRVAASLERRRGDDAAHRRRGSAADAGRTPDKRK
jgi:AcrR family transcriptional regulator